MMMLCCISLLSLFSCSLDTSDANFQFTTLQIVSADFPESFEHNQTYDIDVVLIRPNSCSFFEGFEVDAPEITTRVVSAVGSVLTNQACTQAIEEVTATFTFRVDYTDTYIFRFYSGVDESDNAAYVEYEVPVNQ